MVDRIIGFIKNNRTIIGGVAISAVFWFIALFDLKTALFDAESQYRYLCYTVYIIVSAVLFVLVLFILIKMKRKASIRLEKVFLIFGIIMGAVYLCLSPLFTGSDEHNHYYRIYEITEGTLFTQVNENTIGSELPTSLSETFQAGSGDNTQIKYNDIDSMLAVETDDANRSQYGGDYTTYYANTALYSPISYVPQVMGFLLGKIFSSQPYIIGLFGRLFNLAFYIALGYFALRLMPRGKLFYLLILLSPNMLQCATTLSADAFVNVVFLLFIALAMKVNFDGQINTKSKVALGILSIVLALCKICYLPITFLLFFFKRECFSSKKEKYLYATAVVVVSTVLCLLWLKSTGPIFDVAYPMSAVQRQYIFGHIPEFIVVVLRTIITGIMAWIECLFVGVTMYHTQLMMPAVLSFFYVAIVAIAIWKDDLKNKLNNAQVIILILIGLCIFGLILLALYLQCTAQFGSIGSQTILGLQGRYFIPLVMLIPFIIKTDKKTHIRVNDKGLIAAAVFCSLITWFYMISHFVF